MTDADTHTPPSWKERQKQERTAEILRVASRELQDKGIHEMQMDDVAIGVGISKGTLYLHFPTKEALIVAVMEHGLLALDAALAEVIAHPSPLPTRLQGVLSVLLSHTSQMTRWMHTSTPEIATLTKSNPLLKQHVLNVLNRLEGLLDEGKRAGQLADVLPSPVLARILLSLGRSLWVDPHVAPTQTEAFVSPLITFFLYGATATKGHQE